MRIVCINGPHSGREIPPMPDDEYARFLRLEIERERPSLSNLASLTLDGKQVFKPEQLLREQREAGKPKACAYRLMRTDGETAFYVYMGEREEGWKPDDEPREEPDGFDPDRGLWHPDSPDDPGPDFPPPQPPRV